MKAPLLALAFALTAFANHGVAQTTNNQDTTCNDVGRRTADTCEKVHQKSTSMCETDGMNSENDCLRRAQQHNNTYGTGQKQQKGMD